MIPDLKQVGEISEVLAFLLEDFVEEASGEEPVLVSEVEEQLSEEALARIVAKLLASKRGDLRLQGLLGAARGMLRGSLEEGRIPRAQISCKTGS
jgi:hypothetical protein